MRNCIPGCIGFEASDDGQIFKIGSDKPKKQRSAGNGALQVDIGGVTRMVHDLVARAFHGDAPAGYRAKHRNFDITDNRAANLYWDGAPVRKPEDQSPTTSLDIEREYQRIENERLALIDLMQN